MEWENFKRLLSIQKTHNKFLIRHKKNSNQFDLLLEKQEILSFTKAIIFLYSAYNIFRLLHIRQDILYCLLTFPPISQILPYPLFLPLSYILILSSLYSTILYTFLSFLPSNILFSFLSSLPFYHPIFFLIPPPFHHPI